MGKPDLYGMLDAADLLEYGSHIPGSLIRNALGIKYPDLGSKREFEKLQLIELQAVEAVKVTLLKQGKTILRVREDYRVPLASENSLIVARYIDAATAKLRRAKQLSINTPPQPGGGGHDNLQARIALKQEGLRRRPGGSSR